MPFTQLEKLLIKLFILKKELNYQRNNKDLNDLNDIPTTKNRNEKGIKSSDKPANLTRKVVWMVVILLTIGVFLTLLILSGITFQTERLNVTSISAINNASYVLTLDNGNTRQISASNLPKKYIKENVVEITYGTSVYNSFAFSGSFSNYQITVEKDKKGTGASYLSVANTVIGINGNVFVIDDSAMMDNYDFIINGTKYKYDDNLSQTLGKALKGFSFSTEYPVPFNISRITSTVFSFIPFLFFLGIIVWSMRRMGSLGGAMGGDNVFSIGRSQAKLAKSNVFFTDVAGIQEEKEELIEIVDYLKRPERYASMGARVPKGVILYGPPGTGKTLLARAVAGEAKVPFFQVSGSAFEDMLVGVGAKRIRDLFTKAIKVAPAIVFIDEIDSVGSKRGKLETTAGSLADQTLNQLLAEMDGFNNRTGVIVMAATNRLDVLDEALLRPGRFDRHIQVTLPDIKERIAILKIHARNKNISTSVDLEDIARRTPGFSGAQLENVLNEATLLAVRRNRKSIITEDLDEAIDRVIAGPAKKTRVISLEEKKQIAYHEAGHAIVGLHTKGSEVVEKITIIPRGQAAGYTLSVPKIQELAIQKKSDLLGMIGGLLGGRAAEEVIFGKDNISTGAANDLYKATNIVRAMVTQLGMSKVGMTQHFPSQGVINPYQVKLFSEKTAQEIDREIEAIFQERYVYATNIIKNNRLELDLIVESLLILETIVKSQIDYIHVYKKLPQEALEKKQELENKQKAAKLTRELKNEKQN